MKNSLHEYRKQYEKHQLLEEEVSTDPLELFRNWIQETATNNEVDEINTMTLSSIGLDGFPKSRVVLLKEYDEAGFVFFTNYNSEKGKAILKNPRVCLSFFWPRSERQIIIKGEAAPTTNAESDVYFGSRPRGSQLGAWASAQSELVPSREYLIKKLADLEREYDQQEVPRPPYWGGFRVRPISFEFWQGRPNRLHDRLLYTLEEGNWNRNRLAP